MARLIMILVLGAVIAYGLTNITLNEYTSQGTQNSMDNYSYNRAHDIANSMVDIILMRMANDGYYSVTNRRTEDLFGGYATYQTRDMLFEGEHLVQITVSAKYNGVSKSVTAYANKFPLIPPSLIGVISANSPILTLGNLRVDGRNHKIDGTLIPNSGTYAIWTTKTFDQAGSSYLGGTDDGIDYPLMKPADPHVIKVLQTYPGSYPTSPDSILGGPSFGYPEGMLKSIAMSGLNGSQYVTDPNLLSHPISGVTYIELTDIPPDNKWEDANVTGSGILVVHNKSTNARVWNMLSGTFVGMVIVDDLVHVQTKVIGAIFCLSPNPSTGSNIGNSDGIILYSTDAVRFGLNQTGVDPKLNYGFGKKRLAVKYWNE